ncbi:MAG: putative membrane protein [bacterium]|jgi:uncharacterized membrane protein
MAGIAFDIRKLLKQRKVSSVVAAFFFSGVVSSGHWIFAVASLVLVSVFGRAIVGDEMVSIFMGMVMYVFATSMVIIGGTQMVITRCLADAIFEKNDHLIAGLFVTSALILGGGTILIVTPLVFGFLKLSLLNKILTILLLSLISCMGAAMIFVSTLKAYFQVALFFGMGFFLTVPISLFLARFFSLSGFLAGLSIGVGLVVFLLSTRIFIEFPGKVRFFNGIFSSHIRHPFLFAYGFFSNIGIWIDKFLYWQHYKVPIGAGLIGYPIYDTMMFFAFLTALPALAYFVLIAETDLYEDVKRYSYFLNSHGSYQVLEKIRKETIKHLGSSFVRVGVAQGVFSLILIIAVPSFVPLLGMTSLGISMMRIMILGSFFQMGMMLMTIVLTYYEGQFEMFLSVLTFSVLNGVGTWVVLSYGNFWLYGYSFFFASFVGFIVASVSLFLRLKNLHFVTIGRL